MKNFPSILIIISISLISGCINKMPDKFLEQGVSMQLAEYRKEILTDVGYELSFSIPEKSEDEIPGHAILEFTIKTVKPKPLVIDFNVPEDYLREVIVNGIDIPAEIINGHIIIDHTHLQKGQNQVDLSFRTGELSLNRNPDFLYTLLVPDRASTAFPCFDQPDIKASFRLKLTVPGDFEAMSNSPVLAEETAGTFKVIEFTESEPISTYLFAFAAGRFERIERVVDGVMMEMLHREPSDEIVERNIDEVFRLHYSSIRWMERYTGINYPFSKFGFVLIPSFQYGGMEHPGAIFYRASSLFLDDSPTINEKMSRAALIAHETSHIWFGDLVTMEWFDDVWLKEVFAGYMADKIVNPDFPEVNHELRFLLTRYPAAYAVDRTRGSNPIIQELGNLRNAGSLYGGIIYNKAPVIMKHLELLTGDSLLQESLKVYLSRFSYGNANWDDLVNIIEEVSQTALKEWSSTWVKESGMPEITVEIVQEPTGYQISFTERDPDAKGRHWPQTVNTLIITENNRIRTNLIPGNRNSMVLINEVPLCVVPDTSGIAYGYFALDKTTIGWLLNNTYQFTNPVTRGVIWLNLYENMLNDNITPDSLYVLALNSAISEENELLRNYLTARVSSIFWNAFDQNKREFYSIETEKEVRNKILTVTDAGVKRFWFNLYKNLAISPESLSFLYEVWKTGSIDNMVKLSEDDLCSLSLVLALKGHPDSEKIIDEQILRITNDDRKARYSFVIPSVSGNREVKETFFESLKEEKNREQEPWVLEALGYIHHPLNTATSVDYILPSLEILEEIKYTGDIFFPGSWISTTLSGHQSAEAFQIVNKFLESNSNYPSDLKLKILQASDHLYRKHQK